MIRDLRSVVRCCCPSMSRLVLAWSASVDTRRHALSKPQGAARRRRLLLRIGAVLALSLVTAVACGQAKRDKKADTPLAEIRTAVMPSLPLTRQPEDGPDADDEAERKARAHYESALELVEDEEFEQAVAELDAALNLARAPGYEMLYLMAQAKWQLRRYGEARLAAEQAIIRRPGAADAHFLLGRLYRKQGRLDAAIAHFRSATLALGSEDETPEGTPKAKRGVTPRLTVAWYELGECLAEAGYLWAAAEALERFDRAIWEEHPEHQRTEEVAPILKRHPYGAIERRLELLRQLDRPAELARAAEWALASRPDEPYLERLYVGTLLEAGQAAQAFELCQQRLLSPDAPGSVPTLLGLAIETGCAAGRLDEWVSQLAEDLSQGQHVDLARRLAHRLDGERDYSLSIPLWRALAGAQPEEVDAAWALASALKESGDLAAALNSLIEFVRRNADSAEIPPERLGAWMRSFEVADDFLRRLTDLTARDDCDFATYTVLAATAAAAGQTELAERLFGAALQDRPGFALAHMAWAQMLLAGYRWEEALAHAEEALATAPDSPTAHFLRGEACGGVDEYEQAEAAYKAALEARPDETAYVLALARHCRRTGNLLGAQRYFQQAWSMDHTQGGVVEELIDSYLEGGKVEIAHACLREAEASDVSDDVLRRVRTALRFARAPMQAEHLAELARQFEEFPADVSTGLKLAAGLYINHRADEALEVLQQVQTHAPDDERWVYLLARVHLRRVEGERAIALLEELVRRYPRRRSASRLLADSYLTEFRVAEARQTLQRMLATDLSAQQREQLRLRLLGTYLEFGGFDAALKLVEQWLATEPDEDAWARAKLRVLLAAECGGEAVEFAGERLDAVTRRFEELKEDFKGAAEGLRAGPEDAELEAQLRRLERELSTRAAELHERRSEYVQVCLDAGRYEPAEERVRAWLADQPQWQESLIEILLEADRAEEALKVLGELVAKTPTDVLRALIWRARGFADVGKLDDAIDDLTALLEESFIQGSPAARAQVRQEMLTLLVDGGDFERALALCDRWLADVPDGDRAARLGILLLKRFVLGAADRIAEQCSVMEELLEFQPYDPGLNNDLGYTWADRGEHLERAVPMIKLAVAAEPLNAAFLDSLGWVYYKGGDFDAARVYLARSVRLRSGQDPLVYDHLGDVEYRLGDHGAARRHWDKALTLLDEQQGAEGTTPRAKLIAALRGKLHALEQSEPPPVAPTAAEQQAAERGAQRTEGVP